MTTALKLTREEVAVYRTAARRRGELERQAVARREERAWELACQAASVLRRQFGATRVVAFGSLVHAGCFTAWSDVDIAAWGIRPEDTFRAIGAIMDISADPPINLVDVKTCSPSLLATIEREGQDL